MSECSKIFWLMIYSMYRNVDLVVALSIDLHGSKLRYYILVLSYKDLIVFIGNLSLRIITNIRNTKRTQGCRHWYYKNIFLVNVITCC